MRSRGGRRRRDAGQVLVLFAGGLVALIAMVGLVIDGGNVFFSRRDDQNASDLASLAGTKRLYDYYVTNTNYTSTDNVYATVQKALTDNGCTTAGGCTWTARYVGAQNGASFPDLGLVQSSDIAPPGATTGAQALGVKVDVRTQPRTYFLGIFGQGTWDVRTSAISMTGSITSAPPGQLLPIALVDGQPLNAGTIYALTSGSNGPGNFGWVSWDGSNTAGSLATSLCTPNNPAFTLPYQFPGDPGKTNASAVRACLQMWVDSGQTILIPIVYGPNDNSAPAGCKTGGNGNNYTYCIKRVVAFTLTGYAQPAVDQINGRFDTTMSYATGQTVPAGTAVPPTSGGTNYIGLAK
jgi:Flp pilus assembly protein TadG